MAPSVLSRLCGFLGQQAEPCIGCAHGTRETPVQKQRSVSGCVASAGALRRLLRDPWLLLPYGTDELPVAVQVLALQVRSRLALAAPSSFHGQGQAQAAAGPGAAAAAAASGEAAGTTDVGTAGEEEGEEAGGGLAADPQRAFGLLLCDALGVPAQAAAGAMGALEVLQRGSSSDGGGDLAEREAFAAAAAHEPEGRCDTSSTADDVNDADLQVGCLVCLTRPSPVCSQGSK